MPRPEPISLFHLGLETRRGVIHLDPNPLGPKIRGPLEGIANSHPSQGGDEKIGPPALYRMVVADEGCHPFHSQGETDGRVVRPAQESHQTVVAAPRGDRQPDPRRVRLEDQVAAEQRLAHEGIGDIHALREEIPLSDAAYQNASVGATPEEAARLQAKRAMLTPLLGEMDPAPLLKAQEDLPRDHPLFPWLSTALCWAYAEKGQADAAGATCQEMILARREPISSLMKEVASSLDKGLPLPPYRHLFSMYADNCLRLPQGGEP